MTVKRTWKKRQQHSYFSRMGAHVRSSRPDYLLSTSRYDLLHDWTKTVARLRCEDRVDWEEDFSIFLEDWPQLKHRFTSKEIMQDVKYSSYLNRDILHCITYTHTVIVWRFKGNAKEIQTERLTFPTTMIALLYINERRCVRYMQLDTVNRRLNVLTYVSVIMVNYEPLQKIRVDEVVIEMGLTSEHNALGFWCFTNNGIVVYEYSMFSVHYAYMDSTVYKLQRILGNDQHPNRILVATELVQQFAYNSFRGHTYLVMGEGSVLVLDCSKSPFRGVEVFDPSSADEAVTCITGGLLIMASDLFLMPRPLQAHHAPVECLDMAACISTSGDEAFRSNKALVSAGADYAIKVWKILCKPLTSVGLDIRLQLMAQFSGYSWWWCSVLWLLLVVVCLVVFSLAVTPGGGQFGGVHFGGYSWCCMLDMYDISPHSQSKTPPRLNHTPDYDHTHTVTSLQKCPLLRIFATSSLDCTIKIWDDQNELVRELIFLTPVADCCFASDMGDLLSASGNILRIDPSRLRTVSLPNRPGWQQSKPKKKLVTTEPWEMACYGPQGRRMLITVPIPMRHHRRQATAAEHEETDIPTGKRPRRQPQLSVVMPHTSSVMIEEGDRLRLTSTLAPSAAVSATSSNVLSATGSEQSSTNRAQFSRQSSAELRVIEEEQDLSDGDENSAQDECRLVEDAFNIVFRKRQHGEATKGGGVGLGAGTSPRGTAADDQQSLSEEGSEIFKGISEAEKILLEGLGVVSSVPKCYNILRREGDYFSPPEESRLHIHHGREEEEENEEEEEIRGDGISYKGRRGYASSNMDLDTTNRKAVVEQVDIALSSRPRRRGRSALKTVSGGEFDLGGTSVKRMRRWQQIRGRRLRNG
ncbi:hypothetical protein ACOMHN_020930 [Nucella lapillus]